jgi:Protein of unknown function (DUF4038)/Putative collagen-binding domain of a collagenase
MPILKTHGKSRPHEVVRGIAPLVLGLFAFTSPVRTWAKSPAASRVPAYDLRLKISANGRYLVDQRGRPFLVVGDSPWSLIVQLDEKDIETYLRDRQEKGFNSLIVNLLEHKFTTNPPRTRAGLAPFTRPGDFSTPNDAYFDFARRVIEKAGERGMVVWLAPAYLGYGGGDEGFFKEIKAGGPEKLRAYGRYVGRKFRDLPNIVWMLGGDYTPEKSDEWTVTALSEAIREEDSAHLMTAHHSPGGSAVEAFGDQRWLDINNVYSYEKELFRPMLAEFARRPVRPFVLLETTYEGEHDSTPDQIRRQAYWATLSGACGQFFGNNPIWHFDGPGLFPAKTTWQEALDSEGSNDVARLRKLFAGLAWQKLVPDTGHEVLTGGFGDGVATAMAATTEDEKLAVVYVPSAGTATRVLTIATDWAKRSSTARWFNPASGKFFAGEGTPFANHGTQRICTPGANGSGANDWVLVLEATREARR